MVIDGIGGDCITAIIIGLNIHYVLSHLSLSITNMLIYDPIIAISIGISIRVDIIATNFILIGPRLPTADHPSSHQPPTRHLTGKQPFVGSFAHMDQIHVQYDEIEVQ